MKRLFYLIFVGFLAMSMSYCSGDTGDTGPIGEQGKQGEQGDPGADGKNGSDLVIASEWINLADMDPDDNNYAFIPEDNIISGLENGLIMMYLKAEGHQDVWNEEEEEYEKVEISNITPFQIDLYTLNFNLYAAGAFFDYESISVYSYIKGSEDLNKSVQDYFGDIDVEGPGLLFKFEKQEALDTNAKVRYIIIPEGTAEPSAIDLGNYKEVTRHFGIQS